MNKTESGFVKEERYVVLKRKDISAALNEEERRKLDTLTAKVLKYRIDGGRGPLSCVVVEEDWPETPVIWSMIEARMTGGIDFVQWQGARIAELERNVARLVKEAEDAANPL